jgi:uncharacterized protein (TIGR04255 family)
MPFPETNRVVYSINPIDRVICQYRFPPILKIDSEIPSQFQEKIRDRFPLFSERQESIQEIGSINNPDVSPDLLELITKSSKVKIYEFLSEDRIFKINLTRTFISFTAIKYERWETYMGLFEHVLTAFIETYNPPFFTRVGLRYIDIFNRIILGLKDVGWDRLIKKDFLGLLSSEFSNNIENFESIYEINLSDGLSKSRIRTAFVLHKDSKEKCYMVDSDFYKAKRVLIADACTTIDFLHQRATRLIRWIITEDLHKAMGPNEIK